LYVLAGPWTWTLQSNDIFCSDVFFPLGNDHGFAGTISLLYPDDLSTVKSQVEKLQQNSAAHQSFSFRIIDSYGQVHSLCIDGALSFSEEADYAEAMHQQEMSRLMEERLFHQSCERMSDQLQAYQYAERMNSSGVWTINTLTHEVYYSDGIYRMFGLPPQSLNAHLHTFTPFIHPDDRSVVISFTDRAYREQVPLHLSYRLLLNHGEIRHVQLTTRWRLNARGEALVSGVLEDCTAQVQAEQQIGFLQNSYSMQEQLLHHAESMNHMANWHLNLITRKIEYSDQLYRIYGLKTPTLLNHSVLLNYVHPEDRALMEEVNRRILYEHIAPDTEYRIIRPDGKIRQLRQKGKLVINSEEEMVMIGTIVDITETHAAETRRQLATAELELLQLSCDRMEEMAGTGSWIWDIDSGDVEWSRGLHELLGYKPGTVRLSQRVLTNLLHPDDRKLFSDSITRLIEGGGDCSFDFRLLRKGQTRHLQAQFYLVKTMDRQVFIAAIQDRTVTMEQQRQLAEQVAMAELLIDASMERVLVTDANHYIQRWNRALENDTGIRKEAVIGRNLFDVLPQLKTSGILGRMLRVMQGERIQLNDERSMMGLGFYNLLMAPVRDSDNKIQGVLTMMRDTTHQHELRRQLTERLRFIEKLLEVTLDRIIVLDQNMNYLYWNKRAEEYYDLKKEQVQGRNILEVFPGFINDPSYQEFRRALAGETVYLPPTQTFEAKKGYFETFLIPMKDEMNEVSSVLWITHTLSREVIESELQFHALVDNIPDASE
jgi:PAS domain S-box-containing protein